MFLQLNYDATACYDRIIPNLATVVSQQHGVNKQVTLMNARTLQQASYHIRTEMGLSASSYQHSDEFPIYGTGQGSGNSPMIWCFLSSRLYASYDTQAHAATYSNPDRTNQVSLSMIGFVDDSNGQVNMFEEKDTLESLSQMHFKAKHNATVWANLLGATGGALELPKCSFHLMFWKFSTQGAPVLASCPREYHRIEVTDPITSQPQTLEYVSPHLAHKTLGHYKEPAGTQLTQFRQLSKKSELITSFLWSTPLSRAETWLYYHACYLPSILYPLTCSHLTYKQLDQVQRKAMSIIIACCGYNRHTKKEILYGPVEYGGANFRHLYVKQGSQQVTYFLKHWRLNTTVGKALQCALAWTQLSVGVSYPVLKHTQSNLPHMETKWITSLRNFLATIDVGILLDNPGIPPLQRQGDSFIMDHIINDGSFTAAEIRRLNYCRLYLQAVTVSDLTKTTGDVLDNSKLTGHPSLQSSKSNWIAIHQERPSEKEWSLWRKANRLWSRDDGRLHVPLHKWLSPVHRQRNNHFAYRYRRTFWIRDVAGEEICRKYKITKSGCLQSAGQLQSFTQLPLLSTPVELRDSAKGDWQLISHHFPLSNLGRLYHLPPQLSTRTSRLSTFGKSIFSDTSNSIWIHIPCI